MTSEKSSTIENLIVLLFSIFYIAIGIVLIGYFVIENFAGPHHIPVLGILSLVTAYSLFKMKRWTVPLVIGFFFTGITFGLTTLANSITLQTFGGSLLFHITMIAYMVILLIVSVYTLLKRENFT
jgi:hypothetical protein